MEGPRGKAERPPEAQLRKNVWNPGELPELWEDECRRVANGFPVMGSMALKGGGRTEVVDLNSKSHSLLRRFIISGE